jgi:hypothetical protein
MDIFQSSGEGASDAYTVVPVIEVRCLPPPHLRTETDPVSETLCFSEYRTMDIVQKPGNSECYTPSSEPFSILYRKSDLF